MSCCALVMGIKMMYHFKHFYLAALSKKTTKKTTTNKQKIHFLKNSQLFCSYGHFYVLYICKQPFYKFVPTSGLIVDV